MHKILVLIYSRHGHIHKMAEAIAEGARQEQGCIADIKQVPLLDPERTPNADIPVAQIDELRDYDGVIIGTPTHFGNMAGEMKAFLDQATGLWMEHAMVGKVGSVFIATGSQHGGQESAILASQIPFYHLGMVVVGLPYQFDGQLRMDEITGASPYGAGTISGPDGSRLPSANELAAARFQGQHVAAIAKKLAQQSALTLKEAV